jgi:hypothetical protein
MLFLSVGWLKMLQWRNYIEHGIALGLINRMTGIEHPYRDPVGCSRARLLRHAALDRARHRWTSRAQLTDAHGKSIVDGTQPLLNVGLGLYLNCGVIE